MFFKKKETKKSYNLINVAALLIHAAKIDENYSRKEEEIIKNAILKIGANNQDLENIIKKGKEIEENSNQILDFTKEIKNLEETDKIKIVKSLNYCKKKALDK